MENWEKIQGCRLDYEISDHGNIRRVLKKKPCYACHREWETQITEMRGAFTTGYRRVMLRFSNGPKLVPVHRLVLETFVGPIAKGMVGNHKNGNRGDNRLENLEIITRTQDRKHAYEVLGQRKMQGSLHGRSKLTEKQVLEIRRLGAAGTSGKELAQQFHIGPQMISHILTRKNWRHI